ncbi:MAG: oxalate:formate antiporter [Steroidobacteraceae bacterium]
MKFRLIVLWLIVGIPLLWGVSKTLQNALKLFG